MPNTYIVKAHVTKYDASKDQAMIEDIKVFAIKFWDKWKAVRDLEKNVILKFLSVDVPFLYEEYKTLISKHYLFLDWKNFPPLNYLEFASVHARNQASLLRTAIVIEDDEECFEDCIVQEVLDNDPGFTNDIVFSKYMTMCMKLEQNGDKSIDPTMIVDGTITTGLGLYQEEDIEMISGPSMLREKILQSDNSMLNDSSNSANDMMPDPKKSRQKDALAMMLD